MPRDVACRACRQEFDTNACDGRAFSAAALPFPYGVQGPNNMTPAQDLPALCPCAPTAPLIAPAPDPAPHSPTPQICIGPVCIPLNLFLPFVLGLLHQYGYLKWIKKEWVTVRYWVQRYRR